MASEIEICNLALMMLGDNTIISFDEVFNNSDRAKLCQSFYPQVRDEVLRAHPWNCARIKQRLSLISEAPLYQFDNQFHLPTNPYCLKVLDVNDDTSIVWRIEGRKLLTNEDSVNITYTGRVDVGEFDSLLVSAIARRMAAHLAYPITSKGTLFEAMWKAYELVLQEARSVDSQEGTPPVMESNILIDVRG